MWIYKSPEWLKGLSVSEAKQAITGWFDAVAEHYPDLEYIVVVSEAMRSNLAYLTNIQTNNIIEALGGDNDGDYNFVTTAFKMARERWSKASTRSAPSGTAP